MAKVQLSFAYVGEDNRALSGSTMPVTDPPVSSDTLTSSASNQQFSSTAPAVAGCFGRVAATGGAVYFASGANPDATQAPRVLIPDGGVYWYSPALLGHKGAVVDA